MRLLTAENALRRAGGFATHRHGGIIVVAFVLAVVAVLIPLTAPPYWLFLVNITLLTAISATGLNFIMGYAGLVSIGNAAFMGIGAYGAVLVAQRLSLPLPVLILAGGGAGTLASLIIGIPSLRLRGLYLAMGTLALQFIAQFAFRRLQEVQGRPAGFQIPTPDLSLAQWYAVLVVLLLVLLVGLRNILDSRVGRGMMALRESEPGAEGCGIDTRGYKLAAFTVSGFIIGCAGVLSGALQGSVNWESYSLDLAFQYIAVIVIGGLGYLGGGLIGAGVVVLLPAVITHFALTGYSNSFLVNDAIYGVLVMLFILLRPDGISGLLLLGYETLRQRLRILLRRVSNA
jgi:branched-chain amino acid transport system permease protein